MLGILLTVLGAVVMGVLIIAIAMSFTRTRCKHCRGYRMVIHRGGLRCLDCGHYVIGRERQL